MLFSSLFFIFAFLPITLLVYYLVPFKVKNLILLLASLVFYAWGEPIYIFLMALSILVNYVTGLEIGAFLESDNKRGARMALVISVIINLLTLGFYKYSGLVVDTLNVIPFINLPSPELALPIGISFYTFQAMSYIIDVYRGKVGAQRNIITFGAYVTMFPQLIAGPIVRYSDIEKQLKSRTISLTKMGDGTAWFLRGLAKKVLIANNMGMFHDAIVGLGGSSPVLTAWLGCFAYTMQIYFDFSGYSDMAIGLGKMLGFDFLRNFNYPYTSKSITEFWRRWHMSLGSWFREYVYIPLGGNRCSVPRHILNMMIVWGLTGIWHGAAWNFMLWGLYFGVLLTLEKYAFGGILKRLPGPLGHIYTLIIVMISWVIFSSDSASGAISYIGMMFGIGADGFADSTTLYFLRSMIVWSIIAILCSTPLPKKVFNSIFGGNPGARTIFQCVVYLIIFIVCIAFLVDGTYNPFLYFRF